MMPAPAATTASAAKSPSRSGDGPGGGVLSLRLFMARTLPSGSLPVKRIARPAAARPAFRSLSHINRPLRRLRPLTPALSRQARLGELATPRNRIRKRMRMGRGSQGVPVERADTLSPAKSACGFGHNKRQARQGELAGRGHARIAGTAETPSPLAGEGRGEGATHVAVRIYGGWYHLILNRFLTASRPRKISAALSGTCTKASRKLTLSGICGVPSPP